MVICSNCHAGMGAGATGIATAPEGTSGAIFKACWSMNRVVSWLQEWNGSRRDKYKELAMNEGRYRVKSEVKS